ncbi:MAG: DUF4129 domain-containing protein [Armatimonadetes bacterium]|jgi:hypothetical protein|nr:DUF4129 domain-containing protein [Armatimonadota bacterium]
MTKVSADPMSLGRSSIPTVLICSVCAAADSRPSAEWLHREIEAVLAQPEYRRGVPLLQKLLEWIDQLLRGWWGDEVFTLKEAWPGLYWGIVILLIVALVLLLAHILITIRNAFREGVVTRAPVSRGRTADPAEIREQARTLASAGRLHEALHLLFEAVVRQLDRAGALRYDPASTNWEYVAALGGHPPIQVELQALAGELDHIWYGGAPLDGDRFEQCAGKLDRAWELAVALG